jgi:capsular polysaccharide biosynthesis protein
MNDKQENIQKEASLFDIWRIILNNIYFIVIFSLVFLSIVVFYTWFLTTPKYKSEADVMVQVEQDSSNQGTNFDLVNAFRLIDTVAELMEKDIILENAVHKLELLGYEGISINYLRERLYINSSSSSYFITISFIDENTNFISDAVDAVIEAVIEETNVENAFPVLTNKIRRTSFASSPEYDSPNKVLSVILGVAFGLFVSIIIVFAKESLSTHFKSKEEIEKFLNIQVLAEIPLMEVKVKKDERK